MAPSSLVYSKPRKVTLVGMEVDVDLVAQYNPKEVQIEKTAGWTPNPDDKKDGPELKYSAGAPRTLSMELLFDGYEDNVDVARVYVALLMQLISVMDPTSSDEAKKRPSVVRVIWKDSEYPVFQGVLQSVSTRYTMFAPDGTPVRATCAVKLMESTRMLDQKIRVKEPPRRNSW